MIKTNKFLTKLTTLALVGSSVLAVVAGHAAAGTQTDAYIRLNRLKAAEATNFRLQFTAASSQTANIVIDFDGADATDWTAQSGLVNATQAISVATCPGETGDTALPGTLTASGSGAVLTISGVGATTTSTTYCADLTTSNSVTNASAGEYHPTITHGSDAVTVAIRTIAEDQIVITANVPPSFNFVFNNTTADDLGNLDSTSTVSSTGKTITLTTNGASGWILWAKSLNGATKGSLNSAAAGNYKITSPSALGSAAHTLTPGTEDFGLAATINTDAAGGGTVSIDAAYDSTASTKIGVLDTQNFRPVASANGTTTGDIINVLTRATITGATPAANDYTDTITFIGAGNF